MNSCTENKCKCERMCYVLDQCVFTHPLLLDRRLRLLELLAGKLHENDKTKRVLYLFYEIQPPKCHFKKKIFPIAKKHRLTEQANPQSVPVELPKETLAEFLARKYDEPEINFHE